MVTKGSSASVDIEITDGLFHASFFLCGHEAALKRLTKSLWSPEPLLLTNLQSGVLVEGCQDHSRLIGYCEVVTQGSSASVDIEITDGIFHSSFVDMRQL